MADRTRYTANLTSDSNLYVDISTDNVGVGTTNATSKLTVFGDVNVSGVITATSFVGNLTGTASTASGLSGTPNITVGDIIASSATISGNVSVAGTVTYEDVTNVDSVGLITARSGVDFAGMLKESVNITAGKLSANTNINLANGMVHLFTTTETATSTPNIRYDASNSLNSKMDTGESITVVLISAAAAAGYSAELTIDGSAVTEEWLGGSAPTTGGDGGYDVYTYNIIKTGSATFVVLANLVNFA